MQPFDLLRPFDVSRESRRRLEAYVDLLLAWQKRINLIGPSTAEQVWTRHILDAVQLLPLLPPGYRMPCRTRLRRGHTRTRAWRLPAAIEAHLYESNGKKAAFLREASRQTGAQATRPQGPA